MNSDSQRDDTKIGAVMLEADMGELPTPKISTLVLRLLAMQKKNPIFILSKEIKPHKCHYRRMQRINVKMFERSHQLFYVSTLKLADTLLHTRMTKGKKGVWLVCFFLMCVYSHPCSFTGVKVVKILRS